MSKRIVASILVSMLGLSWGATTWYSSQQAQSYYQYYFNQFNQNTLSPVSVKLTSFKSGFLHSRANWEISLNLDPCQPQNSTVLTGYDEITHGFIPSLGWAKIDTHIIWPDAIEPALRRMFASQEPLKIQSWLSFLGNLKLSLHSPQARWKSSRYKLEWLGLDGMLIYHSRNNQLAYQLIVPRFAIESLTAKANHLVLQQLSYSGEQQANRSLLAVGRSLLSIQQVQAVVARQQIGLQGIRMSHQNQLNHQQLDAAINYQVKQILLDEKSVGSFKADFLLGQLDEQALQQSYIALNRLQQQCHSSRQQLWQVLQPIAKKGFKLSLTNAELALFDGKATANAQLLLPSQLPPASPHAANPIGKALQFQGKLTVAPQLLAGSLMHINQLAGQRLSLAEASASVQMLLQGMVEQGYLYQTPAYYQTDIRLANGQLLVNNKPLPSGFSPAGFSGIVPATAVPAQAVPPEPAAHVPVQTVQ